MVARRHGVAVDKIGALQTIGGEGKQGLLGAGSYGQVVLAWDQEKEELVAMKRQPTESDDAVRELHVYESVSDHPNVLTLLDRFVEGKSLTLVFPYMHMSLCDA